MLNCVVVIKLYLLVLPKVLNLQKFSFFFFSSFWFSSSSPFPLILFPPPPRGGGEYSTLYTPDLTLKFFSIAILVSTGIQWTLGQNATWLEIWPPPFGIKQTSDSDSTTPGLTGFIHCTFRFVMTWLSSRWWERHTESRMWLLCAGRDVNRPLVFGKLTGQRQMYLQCTIRNPYHLNFL